MLQTRLSILYKAGDYRILLPPPAAAEVEIDVMLALSIRATLGSRWWVEGRAEICTHDVQERRSLVSRGARGRAASGRHDAGGPAGGPHARAC